MPIKGGHIGLQRGKELKKKKKETSFIKKKTRERQSGSKGRPRITWLFTSQILTADWLVPVPRIRPSGWNDADVNPSLVDGSPTCAAYLGFRF